MNSDVTDDGKNEETSKNDEDKKADDKDEEGWVELHFLLTLIEENRYTYLSMRILILFWNDFNDKCEGSKKSKDYAHKIFSLHPI